MKSKVGILDYGAGNFGSVKRALESLGEAPLSVTDASGVENVERLIFPGVGSARQAMDELHKRGLDIAIKDFAQSGRPLLGICVGMQVLGQWSEEGDTQCLGLLPYKIQKFVCSEPIPHMGWNSLEWNSEHVLEKHQTQLFSSDVNFYFVHSYAAFINHNDCKNPYVLASTCYGEARFAAIVAQRNVWGAQCHVEKSGRAGLTFLQSFLNQEPV